MYLWVFDIATGMFLQGGPCDQVYDEATQGLVRLARHPNPRTERYDGTGGIRPATAPEIAEYDAAESTREETRRFQTDKAFRALVIWSAGKHGMTVQEVRAELVAIYRGL